MNKFITELSSGSPVPGGGGASALIGAVSAALCSMVANLTSGKKKYAEYQVDIERILEKSAVSIQSLMNLIQKDADVFEPLSKAYGIPKDDSNRETVLQAALKEACTVPLEILRELVTLTDIIEELAVKGSRLAISDVGVAASACRCAAESAVMNVFINTKLIKDRDYADTANAEADSILAVCTERCDKIYKLITNELR